MLIIERGAGDSVIYCAPLENGLTQGTDNIKYQHVASSPKLDTCSFELLVHVFINSLFKRVKRARLITLVIRDNLVISAAPHSP